MPYKIKGDVEVGRNIKIDGIGQYNEDKTFTDDKDLVSKKYVDDKSHNSLQNIQGGDSTSEEYYHLTQEEYENLGTGGLEWLIISSNTPAENNKGYLIDASLNNVELLLPPNPVSGYSIGACDYKNTSETNTITLLRNGKKIEGLEDDLIININGAGFVLVYSDEDRGWEIVTEIGLGPRGPGILWEIVGTDSTAELNINVQNNVGYLVDARTCDVNLILHSDPEESYTIGVSDFTNSSDINSIKVLRNGKKIEGLEEDLQIDVVGIGFALVYTNEEIGWKLTYITSGMVPATYSAEIITIEDYGNYYDSTSVEDALQEIGYELDNLTHNDLPDLQGGDSTSQEYYHLTLQEKIKVETACESNVHAMAIRGEIILLDSSGQITLPTNVANYGANDPLVVVYDAHTNKLFVPNYLSHEIYEGYPTGSLLIGGSSNIIINTNNDWGGDDDGNVIVWYIEENVDISLSDLLAQKFEFEGLVLGAMNSGAIGGALGGSLPLLDTESKTIVGAINELFSRNHNDLNNIQGGDSTSEEYYHVTLDDINTWNSLISFPGFTSLFADYGFTDNSSNWNDAYSWGDHSLEGYIKNVEGQDHNTLSNIQGGDSTSNEFYHLISGQTEGQIAYWDNYKWNIIDHLKVRWNVEQETFEVDTLYITTSCMIGDSTSFSEFESDGTLVAKGGATYFRDELNDLIKGAAQNPASHLVFDYTEGTLDFKDNCDLNDWALMNIQINHDWKVNGIIEPHIHWFQKENKTPNWLIQYRFQDNGKEKTTVWTPLEYDHNAFLYSGTTLVQITSFGNIIAPTDMGVSGILQIRILRDVDNDSGLFDGGIDTYTGDAEALSFDVHIECDTLGSRQIYSK